MQSQRQERIFEVIKWNKQNKSQNHKLSECIFQNGIIS
jgi:hypothetical protein